MEFRQLVAGRQPYNSLLLRLDKLSLGSHQLRSGRALALAAPDVNMMHCLVLSRRERTVGVGHILELIEDSPEDRQNRLHH
jgi:hypothetical protein